jgi:heat shock protein HtpX
MPLTFIDIEKQKSWHIWIFFLVLMILYFIVSFALALPFMPHVMIFYSFGNLLLIVLMVAALVAGIHILFTGYDAVNTVISSLSAQAPDPNDDVHKTLLNIMQEIHVVTGNTRTIECVVIPSLSMNALAASDLKGRAVIGITEGLLSRLNRPQIETVVAHEANHILSGDCLETTIAASLFGSLTSLMDKYSATSEGPSFPHPFLWPAWMLLKISSLLNMFISREREYRADAAAVRMTRNPLALAETLHLLSRSWRGAGFIGRGLEMMCIVNPESTLLDETEGFVADLFSTHPPLKKRIDILLTMAHAGISELDVRSNIKAVADSQNKPEAHYYAMNPQQQWQGPFTLAELGMLPWLSPLTWMTRNDTQATDRAWKDPLINDLFAARLTQEQAASDFTCPSCRQPLVLESYEGTRVSQCRFCSGTLVESDKIMRILARSTANRSCSDRLAALTKAVVKENLLRHTRRRLTETREKPGIPLLSCPKCHNPMYRGFFSAMYFIEIDRCSFCGITWFDREELEMLQCLIQNKVGPVNTYTAPEMKTN